MRKILSKTAERCSTRIFRILLSISVRLIEIIFKLRTGFYGIINMMVVDKDTLLLFVNCGKYFNRIQKLAVQMPKVKKNCPKLYAIMQGTDKDQVHQGHIVRDGEDLNGFCMTVTVPESLPINPALPKMSSMPSKSC